ncbi:MAG: hypothetical protein RIA10_00160 [Amphiplicatus sp.]
MAQPPATPEPIEAEPLGEAPAEPVPETVPDTETTATQSDSDADNMASQLNARQQIKQTFTVTRTINGEVVETDQRTVTYSRSDPTRPSEAGSSVVEELLTAFNNEVLTRAEAFEEAKLDFVVADLDRDNLMSEQEFIGLVDTWRTNAARKAATTREQTARDRQYRAFIEELNPNMAAQESAVRASRKFAFMAGASPAMARDDYIREYLLDFDSMDSDGDGILRGEQLMEFRALNKGETLPAAPVSAETPATPPSP